LQGEKWKTRMHMTWMSQRCHPESLSFSNSYAFSFVMLYIMISLTSLRLFSRLYQFNCCKISTTLDVFCCLLMTNLTVALFDFTFTAASQTEQAYSVICLETYRLVPLRRLNWCQGFEIGSLERKSPIIVCSIFTTSDWEPLSRTWYQWINGS
jgi:hypothetical protein